MQRVFWPATLTLHPPRFPVSAGSHCVYLIVVLAARQSGQFATAMGTVCTVSPTPAFFFSFFFLSFYCLREVALGGGGGGCQNAERGGGGVISGYLAL